jgi:hypothetical protein
MTELSRFERPALYTGIIAALLCGAGAFFAAEQLFRSYLMAYLFWLALAVGCLPLLMLHHLVGGGWGFVIRRILEAGSRTIPLIALLFLPILLGAHHLYEWANAEAARADLILQAKASYLNLPFFTIRAIIYFATWMVFAYYLNRWSLEQDERANPLLVRRFQFLSAPGIVAYALTITFASVDWAMSLEPHWFSTIYGMLFMVGQTLATLAFVIPVVARLSETRPLSEVLDAKIFQDLGNLLLAFVMLWAYLSFSQYLIIWSGNLPEETPWYLRRGQAGWQWVAALLALFHFVIPFLLLLARGNKRKKHMISTIAMTVLVMRWVDLYWLIAPAFYPSLTFHWLDAVAMIAVGGIWTWGFLAQLRRRSLLPLNDPTFAIEEAA